MSLLCGWLPTRCIFAPVIQSVSERRHRGLKIFPEFEPGSSAVYTFKQLKLSTQGNLDHIERTKERKKCAVLNLWTSHLQVEIARKTQ